MAITKKTETKAAVKETVKPAQAAVKEAEVKKAVPEVKETAPVKAAAPALVKEAVPAPVKEAAPKKEVPVKKAAAPKKEAAPKKTAAPRKAEPVKKSVKATVYVQYQEKEISSEKLIAEAKKAYLAAGNKEADIKTIDVYVKPEEDAAYYVVNGIGSDDYKIFL